MMRDSEIDEPRDRVARLFQTKWFKWGTLLALPLTLVTGLLAFPPLQDYVFGKNVGLEIRVISQVPVFDVRRPLTGLTVVYQGSDLSQSKQGLYVTQVQIANVGDVSITPSNTTTADPIGFTINGGSVIKISAVKTSSKHLAKYAKPYLTNNNDVSIDHSAILDSGDFVTVSLLILKPNNSDLAYLPHGKVSGLKDIAISAGVQNETREFLSKLLDGSTAIWFLRWIMCTAVTLALLLLADFTLGRITILKADNRCAKRRKLGGKIVSGLAGHDPIHLSVIVELFSQVGLIKLKGLSFHVGSSHMINVALSKDYDVHEKLNGKFVQSTFGPEDTTEFALVRTLHNFGWVDVKAGVVDKHFQHTLSVLIDTLVRHNDAHGPIEFMSPPNSRDYYSEATESSGIEMTPKGVTVA